MSSAVQILELIGQNDSIKNHKNLEEMMEQLDLGYVKIDNLKANSHELISFLLPEDEGDENSDDEDSEE